MLLENWDNYTVQISSRFLFLNKCRFALLLVMRGASSIRGFGVIQGSPIQNVATFATVTEVMLLKNDIRAITGVASTSVLHCSK